MHKIHFKIRKFALLIKTNIKISAVISYVKTRKQD